VTKAITVQQPWATAIAWGTKNIENRSRGFTNKYRGELLIHAGGRQSVRGWRDPRVRAEIYPHFRDLARDTSLIVAVCDLDDVHPDANCCRPWGESSYPGQKQVMHLVLSNVTPLSVPWQRGQLGLWNPPPSLLAAVFPGRQPQEVSE
jgi:hypothetical protein